MVWFLYRYLVHGSNRKSQNASLWRKNHGLCIYNTYSRGLLSRCRTQNIYPGSVHWCKLSWEFLEIYTKCTLLNVSCTHCSRQINLRQDSSRQYPLGWKRFLTPCWSKTRIGKYRLFWFTLKIKDFSFFWAVVYALGF